MEANLLRSVGIAVGAAALAGSLAIATMNRAPEGPIEPAPLIAAPITTSPPPAESAEPSDPAVFETADAMPTPPPGAPILFVVRFQGRGPLGRAQHLAEAQREAEASAAARSALLRQPALRGLCFDRFTVGGAEMVLRVCEPPSGAQHAQTSAQWLARLRDMPAVAYAEMNSTAEPSRNP